MRKLLLYAENNPYNIRIRSGDNVSPCGDYMNYYRQYIYQAKDWPVFKWDTPQVTALLLDIRYQQGRLLGNMDSLGFQFRKESILETMIQEVVKSSEIEGEILDIQQVRSSVARRLGLDTAGLPKADREVEGVVDVMFDATSNFEAPLTERRLFDWHASLFPSVHDGLAKIKVGAWRDDKDGPMRVISGPIGREKVHFEAPPAADVKAEMQSFLEWFNTESDLDLVIRAGLAHLWFVTLHPFADGNGRIARAITDMTLARSENTGQRYYSMSAQIRKERNDYYNCLEHTQKGAMDVTVWLVWFLGCLKRAIVNSENILARVIDKAKFWEHVAEIPLNERQIKLINRLLDGFVGKLTSSKWAKIAKCSQDTAYRDIMDLVNKNILVKNPKGGRSTNYSLRRKGNEIRNNPE